MTVPEYFELKYSRGLRIVTGGLVALGGILNMGVFLKIEGQFLTIVSGIDTRHIVRVMTVILLLELIYTVLGGMLTVRLWRRLTRCLRCWRRFLVQVSADVVAGMLAATMLLTARTCWVGAPSFRKT